MPANDPYGKLSRYERMQEKTLQLDMYRKPFLFLLPDHNEQYRTFLGSILSLITFLIMGFYSVYKIMTLFAITDYRIMKATSENYFDVLPGFSERDGFSIAAAVTAYDGSPEPIEDPEIGTLKIYLKYWGHPQFGEDFGFKELKTELCDPARDFNNLEGTVSTAPFYALNKVSVSDLDKYGPKMKCIAEPYEIFGDFNTNMASNLMFVFEKCDRHVRKCKSEAEIEDWMTFKYILTLTNEKKFIQHQFGQQRIMAISSTNWHPLSYTSRSEYVKIVTRSKLELNDSLF